MLDFDQIKKKFPYDFPIDLLPPGAKEERIETYRICKTGKVENESFLPTYIEFKNTKEFDENDIGDYSLSTYYKFKDAKRQLKFFSQRNPASILAIGCTDPSCGPCQRSKERTHTKTSHVDWWLYEGAQPHLFFEEYKEEEIK